MKDSVLTEVALPPSTVENVSPLWWQHHRALENANEYTLLETGLSPASGVFRGHKMHSVFQPIVSMTHQRTVGYESLLRASIQQRYVPPDHLFAGVAEVNARVALDRLCRALHVANFARLQAAENNWLFVNIDCATINHDVLPESLIQSALISQGIKAEQVVLEIVEHQIPDAGRLKAFVAHYRHLGFQIAIDDFGRGESNFDRIWKIEPQIVKLDRSMLVHALEQPRARSVLKGLVQLIRQSGCLVLIEGVECHKGALIAQESEADMCQGYFFGKPQAGDASLSDIQDKFRAMHEYGYNQSVREKNRQRKLIESLRLAIRSGCDQLALGSALAGACTELLTIAPVKRCFLLDRDGHQLGKTAFKPDYQVEQRFNPLYEAEGARWAHRDYFQAALRQPELISVSSPYTALPDLHPTITLSLMTYTPKGRVVLCVDLEADELWREAETLPAVMGM